MNDLYDMSASVSTAYSLWEVGKNKKAFQLFLEAAGRGEKLSYNTLGYFFDHGIGTRRNSELAIYWYRRAARIGDCAAFNNLAHCYLSSGNLRRAKFWIGRAIAQGDERLKDFQ